jgi:glutamate formiminotransferase
MSALVECVPNFSEGRNRETVSRIADAIAAVDTSCILDTHIDPDHNRSVITFVASPERVVTAAFNAVAKASELIDMRLHSGEHPRLGATDVLPFVPIKGVSLDDCAALAHEAGQRIANELSIPVYFYERAAKRIERVNLEDVRRGALELLREQITTHPDRAPDVGPLLVHEKAGRHCCWCSPVFDRIQCRSRKYGYIGGTSDSSSDQSAQRRFTVLEGLRFSVAHAQSRSSVDESGELRSDGDD